LADPHLAASGGLVETALPDGRAGVIPGLPVSLAGRRFATRRPPPKLGEHNAEILSELGLAAK
jgi:crotonobetainyl-CoA:carnitine CoA-transferase CaiB-like acyl-CoA transferase